MSQIRARVDVYRPDCSDVLCFVDARGCVVYDNRAAREDAKLVVMLQASDAPR